MTKPWSKSDGSRYLALDLAVHDVMAGVPLHDVWQVELPGGGAGRTIDDVRALFAFEEIAASHRVVGLLFRLRGVLGAWFGWDAEPGPGDTAAPPEALHPVPEAILARSTAPPGSRDGPFRVRYVLERETLGEIRNATVHAFSAMALEPTASGYRAHWAIYVQPVGGITRFYMALIGPFRRFLVYPAVLRHVHRAWCERFGGNP